MLGVYVLSPLAFGQKMIPTDCVKWVPMTTVKKKAKIPATLKSACWDKHIGAMIGTAKCVCCGIYDIRMDKFHCGHVIAEAKGGILAIENLRPICDRCNSGMGTENLDDFRRRCNFVPQQSNVIPIETPVNIVVDDKKKIKLDEAEERRKKMREGMENQYIMFKQQRIQDMRDSVVHGLEEMGNEEATLKDFAVAYTCWMRKKDEEGVLRGKKFSKQEMQNRLDKDFGPLVNGVYKRVMVFFDDEGKAEFLTERKIT